jgi:hypothetical protein
MIGQIKFDTVMLDKEKWLIGAKVKPELRQYELQRAIG